MKTIKSYRLSALLGLFSLCLSVFIDNIRDEKVMLAEELKVDLGCRE